MAVEVFIDPGDERGLAEQIYVQVRDAIVEGRLVAGDTLTSSRTLAVQLGISRFTVTEAYGRLAAEGYVDGRRRGGTIVTSAVAAPSQVRPRTAIQPRAFAASITPYDRDPTATARHDLRPGTVDPSLFPLQAWRRCATAAMKVAPPHYGDAVGAADLRAVLAHWIGRTRGVVASADEVVITAGALHGMDLVLRALVGPGDVVAMEEPGYPPAVDLLRSHGLTVVGVPVDAQGLVVDAIPPRARRRVRVTVASVPARSRALPPTAAAAARLGGETRRGDRGGRLRQPVPLRHPAARAAATARPGRSGRLSRHVLEGAVAVAARRLRRRAPQHHPRGGARCARPSTGVRRGRCSRRSPA